MRGYFCAASCVYKHVGMVRWRVSWVAWVHFHPCLVHMCQVDACVCGATLECMVVGVRVGGGRPCVHLCACMYCHVKARGSACVLVAWASL